MRRIPDQPHHRRRLAKGRLRTVSGKVRALLAALEARDGYTAEHSSAVGRLAVAVGRQMRFSRSDRADLENAALLHDIGKIGVPDSVLRKPGALTPAEWTQMRRHPEVGQQIVASVEELAHLAPLIRAEHERWDGGGYPDGLSGEDIPLTSRIVFACDAYQAMTSDRPYRSALSGEVATEELRTNAGSQFCPTTVTALLSALDADPA